MARKKVHSVTVSIVSESDGIVNQDITLTEYANDETELAWKHTKLGNAVVAALSVELGVMAEDMMEAVSQAGGDFDSAELQWQKGRNR